MKLFLRHFLIVSALPSFTLGLAVAAQSETPIEKCSSEDKPYLVINSPSFKVKEGKSKTVQVEFNQKPGVPRNWRTSLDNVDSKKVKTTGLKETRISGSAEFSETQLKEIKKELSKKGIPAKDILIVDLRQEPHGIADGKAISWYQGNDDMNCGKDREEILGFEKSLLKKLPGKQTEFTQFIGKEIPEKEDTHGKPSMWQKKQFKLPVNSVLTEESLVKKHGLNYTRITAPDHQQPEASNIEQFIELYKTQLKSNPSTWIHFHCAAGKGRTTTFMVMYDMIKNADKKDLTADDFIERQFALGGLDLNKEKAKTAKRAAWNLGRKKFIHRFFEYTREQGPLGFQKSWSEWTKEKDKPVLTPSP
jgi:protein-tyrosine phosphatase